MAARSRASRPSARPSALTILAPALVTAQPRFDTDGCLIGACIGIGRERFGFEHDARVEMNHALGAETEPLPGDGDVPGKSAVEIFGHGIGDARIDALAQRFADVDVLARDAKWHDRPPMTARSNDPGRAHVSACAAPTRFTHFPANLVRRRKRLSTLPSNLRHDAPPKDVCFSRRRCTDEAIRIASRYFATVRRAMSIPASRSFSTMVSSDSTCSGLSASISCLMRWRTASAEWASPPSAAAIAEVKKYFSSKMPRLVARYLLAVTRETVDSCMSMASAMVLRLSGRKCRTPCTKKACCWRTISVDTFRMVLAR